MIIDRPPLVQAPTLATKVDKARLEASIARVEGSVQHLAGATKSDIGRLDGSIAGVEAFVQQLAARTKSDIAQLAASTRADLRGLMITVAGILFAALRYVGHPP